jgi:methionyl-tRNA formyltransferase
LRIIFVAYRDWAIKVYPKLIKHTKIIDAVFCSTVEELYLLDLTCFDLLVTVGLSEKISDDVYKKILTIGLHCAELDRYSYGTPIQLQILDGIVKTKHRIFRLTANDSKSLRSHAHTREYSHEVDLFLHGNMQDVFDQLYFTSVNLLNSFIDDYPDIKWQQWPIENIVRVPRKPQDSKLEKEELLKMTTKELYNLIRALESPYPNIYIEDEEGILYFSKVTFKQKL